MRARLGVDKRILFLLVIYFNSGFLSFKSNGIRSRGTVGMGFPAIGISDTWIPSHLRCWQRKIAGVAYASPGPP